jgi:hypothetical protein
MIPVRTTYAIVQFESIAPGLTQNLLWLEGIQTHVQWEHYTSSFLFLENRGQGGPDSRAERSADVSLHF